MVLELEMGMLMGHSAAGRERRGVRRVWWIVDFACRLLETIFRRLVAAPTTALSSVQSTLPQSRTPLISHRSLNGG